MFKALVKVGACTILGAGTAVGVAWGFALRGTPDGTWLNGARVAWADPGSGKVTAYVEGPSGTGARQMQLMRGPGTVGPDWIRAELGGGLRLERSPPFKRIDGPPHPCHPPEGKANCRHECQFGWPLVCTWGASDTAEGGGCVIDVLGPTNALRVWPIGTPPARPSPGDYMFPFMPDPQRQSWHVPTGIMWRPFAIDSGAYGAAWWIVLLAPGFVRRAVRRRRGQCAACGYSLAGNTTGVCPECGKICR